MYRFPIFRCKSISRQMLLWFLGSSLVPLASVMIAFDAISLHTVRREAIEHLDAMAESKASQMETFAFERRADALALARRPSVAQSLKKLSDLLRKHGFSSPDYAAAEEHERDSLQVYPEVYGYTNVYLVSPAGDELLELEGRGKPGTNFLTGPYRDTELARSFRQAVSTRKLAFSDFAPSERAGDAVTSIAVPVFEGDELLGVSILEVGSAQVYAMVNNYSGLGKTGEIVVASLKGDTITFVAPTRHDPHAAFKRTMKLGERILPRLLKAVQGESNRGIGLDYRMTEVVAAGRNLPSWRWGMVAKMDADEVFASVIRERRWGYLLGVLILLPIAGLAFWAASSLATPVLQLTNAAQQMASGDLNVRLAIERSDEIGELARSFNVMSAALKDMYATIEDQVQLRTRELRDQEGRFRQLAENIREVFWLITPDFSELIYVSPAFERVWGRSVASLYASPGSWLEAIHPDDRERVHETWRQAVSLEQPFESEYRLLRSDGAVRWILDRGFPVRDPTGKLYRMAGVAEDFTDRKRAEETLRRRANLLNLSHDAIIGRDMESRITFWNRGAEERYGWTTAEAIGHITHEVLKTHFSQPLEKILGELQSTGRWDGELVHATREGRTIVVSSRWSLERDVRGVPMGMLEINNDVTDRKRAEEALRRSNAYNRSLIEASLDPLVTIGPDGKIKDVNVATETVTGHSRADLIGTDFASYFTEPAKARAGYEQAFREGAVRDFQLEIQQRDHIVTPVLYNASVFRDESGEISGVFAAARDITIRLEAEEAMRRAKEAAEEADRVKGDFLMNISHEIRTPMNGIIGLTELALDTPLSVEQRGYLEGVMRLAESLLKMIDAILDFSRIEEQGLELEPAPFKLRESLGSTIDTLETRAREKGLAFVYEIRPDVPDELVGDLARLWQVLVNLAGNAIKFTLQGKVSLLIETERLEADNAVLRFSIKDTSIGIPPDKRGVLFKPFSQVDTSKTRKFGGAGLGLIVSARLVELMGGRIWFESEFGKGSTFYFTTRLDRPNSAVNQAAPNSGRSRAVAQTPMTPALAPLRILVVEDNPINQHLVAQLLHKAGHAVAVADDGQQALRAIAHGEFDVVLMDVQMPVMDGFEATAAIRRNEQASGRHLPIVALTAHAMQGDREKCLEAGMDGYISKPIQKQELFAAIAAATDVARGEATPSHSQPASALK
jgi:PAS domain S-box-containing protein